MLFIQTRISRICVYWTLLVKLTELLFSVNYIVKRKQYRFVCIILGAIFNAEGYKTLSKLLWSALSISRSIISHKAWFTLLDFSRAFMRLRLDLQSKTTRDLDLTLIHASSLLRIDFESHTSRVMDLTLSRVTPQHGLDFVALPSDLDFTLSRDTSPLGFDLESHTPINTDLTLSRVTQRLGLVLESRYPATWTWPWVVPPIALGLTLSRIHLATWTLPWVAYTPQHRLDLESYTPRIMDLTFTRIHPATWTWPWVAYTRNMELTLIRVTQLLGPDLGSYHPLIWTWSWVAYTVGLRLDLEHVYHAKWTWPWVVSPLDLDFTLCCIHPRLKTHTLMTVARVRNQHNLQIKVVSIFRVVLN